MTRARPYQRQQPPATPTLLFGPGEPSGFTSVGVAGFQDLDPAAVVRELIQNSLDAARQAGRPVARVRFETCEHALSVIPGITQYRRSFSRAERAHSRASGGELPAQAALVVNAIDRRLNKKRCTSLFVIDNGVGLDETRMSALLGDGLSLKDGSSAGAFGNGHYVAIPVSDLRYILYGGVDLTGSMICSGHAILASHMTKGETKGKDGYYACGFREGRLLDRFEFAKDDQVPRYIGEKLHWIRTAWKESSGSVIAIPAFNRFNMRDSKSLREVVWQAASCNFFSAFSRGELCVEMVEEGTLKTLDQHSIEVALDSVADQRRSRRFLSGSRARSAYESIRWDTHKHIVATESGEIPIWLRQVDDAGISRIDLCRAGMWISDDIPRLRRYQFADLRPFHCVLQLDAKSRIHDLVRKAEGPLHNHLEARKWLSRSERGLLEDAFAEVAKEIRKCVSSISSERVAVSDVLSVESHGFDFGGRRPSQRGHFAEMRAYRGRKREDGTTAEEGDGPSGGEERGESDRRKGRGTREGSRPSGRSLRFRAIAVPAERGRRSWHVEIQPEEEFVGAEVRFALDESLDASCDDSPRDTFVILKNVRLGDRQLAPAELTKANTGKSVGVELGESGTAPWSVRFDFELPDEININSGSPVVLKTMLFEKAQQRPASGDAQTEERGALS